MLDDLTILTRLDQERQQRDVMLPEAVREVFRQLRQLVRARQVELRVQGELPPVQVNAAAVELCLSNDLSNGEPVRPASNGPPGAPLNRRTGATRARASD